MECRNGVTGCNLIFELCDGFLIILDLLSTHRFLILLKEGLNLGEVIFEGLNGLLAHVTENGIPVDSFLEILRFELGECLVHLTDGFILELIRDESDLRSPFTGHLLHLLLGGSEFVYQGIGIALAGFCDPAVLLILDGFKHGRIFFADLLHLQQIRGIFLDGFLSCIGFLPHIEGITLLREEFLLL